MHTQVVDRLLAIQGYISLRSVTLLLLTKKLNYNSIVAPMQPVTVAFTRKTFSETLLRVCLGISAV